MNYNMFNKVIKDFVEPYYANNDALHNLRHAQEVTSFALEIAKKSNSNINKYDIIAASMLHDITVSYGRKDHHLTAVKELENNEVFSTICEEYQLNKIDILNAIKDHRASNTEDLTNKPLSELISAADRGRPDLMTLLRRLHRCERSVEQFNHIINKYGSKGYSKYPAIYIKYYGDELTSMQKQIDDIEFFKTMYWI